MKYILSKQEIMILLKFNFVLSLDIYIANWLLHPLYFIGLLVLSVLIVIKSRMFNSIHLLIAAIITPDYVYDYWKYSIFYWTYKHLISNLRNKQYKPCL